MNVTRAYRVGMFTAKIFRRIPIRTRDIDRRSESVKSAWNLFAERFARLEIIRGYVPPRWYVNCALCKPRCTVDLTELTSPAGLQVLPPSVIICRLSAFDRSCFVRQRKILAWISSPLSPFFFFYAARSRWRVTHEGGKGREEGGRGKEKKSN